MNLWAIAMAKDEDDIIDHTLYHLAQQGVDGIIVADNMSQDQTRAKLNEAKENILARYPNIDIEIRDDTEVAFRQDAKMTGLALRAGEKGANWIIPFDIDELWFGVDEPLKEAVERADRAGFQTLKTPYYDYRVTDQDIPGIPFVSMRFRKPDVINFKIAFKYRPDISIANGNHFVYFHGNPSNRDLSPGDHLLIRHYGIRSKQHFIKKYSNAYKACKALPPNADLYGGAAWNYYFDSYEEGGEEGLAARYDRDWHGTEGLIEDLAPFTIWE